MAEKELSLLDKSLSFFDKKDGRVLPTTDSLITGVPEVDTEETQLMREVSENYQAIAGANIGRDDLLPKVNPEKNLVVDIGNILGGDLMAAFGVELDNEGLRADFDIAKDFWAEHPVRAGTAVALNILPGLAAATKTFRAAKFANLPDEFIRASGLVDEGIDLAMMGAKEKRLLQQQAYQIQETRILNQKVEGGTATTFERAKHRFYKNFGNSYVEQMSMAHSEEGAAGLSKMYSERMQKIVQGKDIAELMEKLPENSTGTAIAKFLNDPNELANIPKDAQPWAIKVADRARALQAQGLEEGFITSETADKVGDIWFSTSRKGSELTNEGVNNSIFSIPQGGGKLKMLSVPRTTSPNLVERATSKSELSLILNRQEAAEALTAGNSEKAIKLLSGKKDLPEVVEAIQAGDNTKAMGILGTSNLIDTTPGSLTVKSLLQQSLLQENFRYLRDISMNTAYTKNAMEFGALGKATQGKMRSLDELPNSHIIRRMVGKKQGLTGPVDRLGYVHEDIFSELTNASTGQPGVASGIVDMLEVITAIHKTSKCVVAGTRILTDRGYERIEEAFEYKDGFLEHSDNKAVFNGSTWEVPLASYSKNVETTYEVILRDGTKVRGTPEHPIFVNGEFRRLDSLQVGEVVEDAHGGPFPTDYVKVSWNPWSGTSPGNSVISIDEDMAELIGWYVGDGTTYKDYVKIAIGAQDYNYSVPRLGELCDRLGLRYTVRTEKTLRPQSKNLLTTFSICNARLIRFFEHLGLAKSNKRVVRVPEVIFHSPKGAVAAFIRGAFDTDGSVSKTGEIKFSTIKEEFARDVHLLLKWLGVPSTVERRDKTEGSHWIGTIGFIYNVRTSSVLAQRICSDLKLFGMPRKLARITDKLAVNGKVRRAWKNRITAIDVRNEPTKVYDISLPDSHEFIADGLRHHNTALNPFTQGQNVWGNYAFLLMRGWNPFAKDNHNLIWNKALPAIWKLQRAARKGAGTELPTMNLGSLASKIGGRDIDIAEEFASVEVGNLIEKSSLMANEGIGVLDKLSKRTGETQTIVKGIIDGAQKVASAPGINHAIDSYLAADGMMKFGYYLDLRARGLSRLGASLEVARALPMYQTVGNTPRVLRKAFLPWVTFPAEALRITKNNVMDYPLRSAMWLHSVDLMQSLAYFGMNENAEGMDLIKQGLPTYANKPASTLLTPFRDNNDDIRAATIDFMPWSSFLPGSASSDANMKEILPFGMGQPMPIADGILMALTGKDQFGKDISSEPGSMTEKFKILALGTMGVIAPPLVSKYFLSPTAPTWNYRMMQDLGKARNPYTTKPGDPFYDMLLNNIGSLGAAKFFSSSPEQMMSNRSITDKTVQDWRGKLTRNWNAFMRNGDWQAASEAYADIKRSFRLEWRDPAIAQKKEMDYLLRHLKTLQQHPGLASYSKERLIEIFAEQGNKVANARGKAYKDLQEMLLQELSGRGGQESSVSKSSLDSSL